MEGGLRYEDAVEQIRTWAFHHCVSENELLYNHNVDTEAFHQCVSENRILSVHIELSIKNVNVHKYSVFVLLQKAARRHQREAALLPGEIPAQGKAEEEERQGRAQLPDHVNCERRSASKND